MVLYHGSTEYVPTPDLNHGNSLTDFGNCFYTTTSYEQAESWALTKMRREDVNIGYITAYEFDDSNAVACLSIRKFDSPDRNWLEFVYQNRKGNYSGEKYDLVVGPVADDSVYRTLRLLEFEVADIEKVIEKLKTEKLHDQWAFGSEKSLSFLVCVNKITVTKRRTL